jgi:protein-tyrosine phosphatase
VSKIRITVVCLGNICRSPIAEAVLRDRIVKAGLESAVTVDSAGTGDWHIGYPADPRAAATITQFGYELDHQARQINATWFDTIDLVLAMDTENFKNLQVMLNESGTDTELRMFRGFDPALAQYSDPSSELDVPDPYYGGEESFVLVLKMIEDAADGLVAYLQQQIN